MSCNRTLSVYHLECFWCWIYILIRILGSTKYLRGASVSWFMFSSWLSGSVVSVLLPLFVYLPAVVVAVCLHTHLPTLCLTHVRCHWLCPCVPWLHVCDSPIAFTPVHCPLSEVDVACQPFFEPPGENGESPCRLSVVLAKDLES